MRNLFQKKAGYRDSFGVVKDLETTERKEKMYWLKSHPSLLRLHRRDMLRDVNYLLREVTLQ
tara:strand:+ start:279 stop:464 length:186 start_codon:yes stop_codon:yes gene_type:complete